MTTTLRQRTVMFFMVVRNTRDGYKPIDGHVDWQPWLSDLSKVPDLEGRTLRSGVDGVSHDLIGDPYPLNDRDSLLVHQVRDPGDWLSQVDWRTNQVTLFEEQAGLGFVDTSIVEFLEYENLVAVMMGSTASPTAKRIEQWLTRMSGDGTKFHLMPVIEAAQQGVPQGEDLASFEIRAKAAPVARSDESGGILSAYRDLSDQYPDATVTIRISASRAIKAESTREKLSRDIAEFTDVAKTHIEKADGTLFFAHGDRQGRDNVINFLTHHLTAKASVVLVGEDGKSVRIAGAVEAIREKAAELKSRLQSAADLMSEEMRAGGTPKAGRADRADSPDE